MYWGDPPDPANGGDIIRRVNEDWPDGAIMTVIVT